MAERSEAATVTSQPRVAPALSATSDAPVVVESETQAAPEAKPGKEATTEKVEAKKEAKVDQKTDGEGEGKDETPAWMKQRITKADNKRRDAEARAADTQARLDTALKALENVTGNKPQTEAKPDPRPERAKFSDPELYDQALIEWSARSATRTAEAEAKTKAAQEAKTKGEEGKKAHIENMQKAWNKAKDAFAAEHPDYEEVAESEDLQISVAVAATLLEDPESGVKLAYWLGQNPDEAERISKMTPQRAAMELGRISDRLEAKAPRDKKPAPIKPIGGSRADGAVNGREPTSEEWFDKRTAQIHASRRPFIPAGRA